LSEVVREAALATDKRALNMWCMWSCFHKSDKIGDR
jgi:hypothetical protein